MLFANGTILYYTNWTTLEPLQNKHEERLRVPNLKPRLPSVRSSSLPSTGLSFSLIVVTSSCNCRGLAAACFVSSHPKLKVKAESLEAGAPTFCCCSTLRLKHLPWQVVVWVWIKSLMLTCYTGHCSIDLLKVQMISVISVISTDDSVFCYN